MCELLLFGDVQTLSMELVAVCLQLILTFGLDGMTLLAFMLVLRLRYNVGGRHGTHPQESIFLFDLCMKSIGHGNDYLLSDQAGDLQLQALVESLR